MRQVGCCNETGIDCCNETGIDCCNETGIGSVHNYSFTISLDGESSERRGGAHMGFSERLDDILS